MTAQRQPFFDRINPIAILFEVTRAALTFALCTIAGYMVIGGLLGVVAQMLGWKSLVTWLPGVGWCLGGVLGILEVIFRARREHRERSKAAAGTQQDESKTEPMRFRMPTPGAALKSIGVVGLLGSAAGIATSVFLTVLLISVTTSPFVPDAWRPSTEGRQPQTPLERQQERTRPRDGVGTKFTHPLIGPIFLWTTGSGVALGLLAGVGFAFVEDNKKSSNEIADKSGAD